MPNCWKILCFLAKKFGDYDHAVGTSFCPFLWILSIYFLVVIIRPSECTTLPHSLYSRKSKSFGIRHTWGMSSTRELSDLDYFLVTDVNLNFLSCKNRTISTLLKSCNDLINYIMSLAKFLARSRCPTHLNVTKSCISH